MEITKDLSRAFDQEENELLLRQSKVACVLGIVLIPAGMTLDAVAYPAHAAMFAAIRFSAAALIAVIFAMHFLPRAANFVRYLTLAGLLVAVSSITAMIALTDGAMSSYYLGLFLILFAVGVLAPMDAFEAGAFCGITNMIYVAGCLLSPAAHPPDLIINNLYFLVLTSIISVTAAHFYRNRRFNEFCLKYKIARQHEKLEALDRLKSQFFANVSHELRTPLTLILAPIEKIRADSAGLPKDVREVIEIIENNALRLFRLVNDILGLIRLEEGGAALVMKPFDLAHFLRHTAASMKHLAAIKQTTLHLTLHDSDLNIMADADAIEKIVGNVVSNAIKFTPAGGRIDIDARRKDTLIEVAIADNGIGIPSDSLPHIFDRFYQVDGSATRRHQGLGLGLAMVRELVSRHGGDVTAESAPGKGTKFIITFPLSLASPLAAPDDPAVPQPAGAGLDAERDIIQVFDRKAAAREFTAQPGPIGPVRTAHEKPGQPRVLIVDDEGDMRRYLAMMLQNDYSVVEASDGASVAGLAKALKPDLILLDVMLPDVNGLEICRILKDSEETRAIKIIILTARADEDAKIIALKHGADDFLIKPFSGLEVRTRIANLLRSATLERDLRQTNAELKRSLQRIQETEAALVQNARLSALGTMAAGLLHEIGNPLNFMGTALQLVARDAAVQNNPETVEILQDIRDGFDRICRVVTDLRGFTAPHKPEDPKPFSMDDCVEHALRFTAHTHKGITIVKHIDPDCRAIGSQSTIAQVIVNLLVNAIAAVRSIEDKRRPEITITAKVAEDKVCVSVRDNGTGIEHSIQEKIFDPFFSTKEVGEGMGLGLAVSHRIIANHGGSLVVKSTPGEWTEFRFNLPLAQVLSTNRINYAVA